jgi:hypothetical protein
MQTALVHFHQCEGRRRRMISLASLILKKRRPCHSQSKVINYCQLNQFKQLNPVTKQFQLIYRESVT